jgi:hypothetical protein
LKNIILLSLSLHKWFERILKLENTMVCSITIIKIVVVWSTCTIRILILKVRVIILTLPWRIIRIKGNEVYFYNSNIGDGIYLGIFLTLYNV